MIASKKSAGGMSPLSLFEDIVSYAPKTEGIKYAGSKLKLLPYILQMAQKTGAKTVLDGFAGTTRVSQALAQTGYQVISNDISVWSKVFGTCYLCSSQPPKHYQNLINHLNALPGKDGWFTEHYGGEPENKGGDLEKGDALKKPWQKQNAQKLDAIREEIEALSLPDEEKAVALTSLILALDEVDSTLGHFASYLKEWSPRSYRPLLMKLPRLIPHSGQHTVLRGDIFDCLASIKADLAYYDPPYGSNNEKMPPSRVRYAAYYHLWTSVCLFDTPDVFGKAKRRCDTSDSISGSVFEEFRKNESGQFIALNAIKRLLENTTSPFILLSYSSGGRATAQELQDIISSVGKLREMMEIDYKRNVMGNMRWTNDWVREAEETNRELLFLIEKN